MPATIWFIYIEDVFAYVRADAMYIMDISNPGNPAIIGTLPGERIKAVEGTLIYVLSDLSLRIFDISNPASPIEIGSYPVRDHRFRSCKHAHLPSG